MALYEAISINQKGILNSLPQYREWNFPWQYCNILPSMVRTESTFYFTLLILYWFFENILWNQIVIIAYMWDSTNFLCTILLVCLSVLSVFFDWILKCDTTTWGNLGHWCNFGPGRIMLYFGIFDNPLQGLTYLFEVLSWKFSFRNLILGK